MSVSIVLDFQALAGREKTIKDHVKGRHVTFKFSVVFSGTMNYITEQWNNVCLSSASAGIRSFLTELYGAT